MKRLALCEGCPHSITVTCTVRLLRAGQSRGRNNATFPARQVGRRAATGRRMREVPWNTNGLRKRPWQMQAI
jgi:hypothetical protein